VVATRRSRRGRLRYKSPNPFLNDLYSCQYFSAGLIVIAGREIMLICIGKGLWAQPIIYELVDEFADLLA